MGLICPSCHENEMKIITKIQLPPDKRSDEIFVQIIKCENCYYEGVAIYEESRRGSINDESIHHRGYCVSSNYLRDIKKKIAQCPSPNNVRCKCMTHYLFSMKDESGRIALRNYLSDLESFEIQFRSS